MKSFYNIHNLIKVRVDNDRKDLQEGYRHYLRYFKTDEEIKNVDYDIQEFKNLPKLNCSISFNKEKYALSCDGKKITEYTTYANRATNLWIEFLLLEHSLSFVHAAGVEIKGKGFIFPAAGGVGKTTLISHLRNLDSFKFFGDDFVILNEQGEMLSYPSDLSIYDYHLKVFPELQNTASSRFLSRRKYFFWYYFCKRAINFLAKRIRISSGPLLSGWNAPYVKVSVPDLIPPQKIGDKTMLSAAVFLERYNENYISTELMGNDELVENVAKILKEEFKYGNSYLSKLFLACHIDEEDFYQKQKKVLTNAFSKIKCHKIRLPENLNYDDYFKYMDNFIESI